MLKSDGWSEGAEEELRAEAAVQHPLEAENEGEDQDVCQGPTWESELMCSWMTASDEVHFNQRDAQAPETRTGESTRQRYVGTG